MILSIVGHVVGRLLPGIRRGRHDHHHHRAPVRLHGRRLYLSTDTLSGGPEVILNGTVDGLLLENPQHLTETLLELVRVAREAHKARVTPMGASPGPTSRLTVCQRALR